MCVPSIPTFYKHRACPFSNKFYTPHTLCLSYKHNFTNFIHCVSPSISKFYTPHKLCPFYNKGLQTSYTVCVFPSTPTFCIPAVIQCVFPSTPTFYTPATRHTYTACSLQHPRFPHLPVIHCVIPSTPTFYTPATRHILRVPFNTHVLHTCYMSYTACSLRHPRVTAPHSS